MTDGLWFEAAMPIEWHEAPLDAAARQALMREGALFLAALNQMEGIHELEAGGAENRRLERMEAKLDLVLHLLARSLEPGPVAAYRTLRLSPTAAEWQDEHPPEEGQALILELRPSDTLPLTLRLPAVALIPLPGLARVSFEPLSAPLDDLLYQFVFRRHRQAIRARGG